MNAMAVVLSPPAVAPPAAPQGRDSDARGGEFARCLGQARDGDGDGGANRADADPAGETSDAPQRAAVKARRERETTAASKRETRTVKEPPPKATVVTDAAAETEVVAGHAQRDEAAAPDLAALLPGWTPPAVSAAAAAAPNATAPDSANALPAEGAAAGVAATTPTARDAKGLRVAVPLDTAAMRSAESAVGNAPTAAAPSTVPLQAGAGEQKETQTTTQTATAPLPTAFALATMPSAPKVVEMWLPTATVQAPIDAPAFAPALATQVRWWAHDGVQQAQLLLNPAEMGPVTVKIVLDGREARIDFSADIAATRSAIEAALPVLAAALDDSGLKLCGGGVHDGAAQRDGRWHERGVTDRTLGADPADAGEVLSGIGAARVASARGLVDLVA